jgi:hypothetical protein
MVAVFKTNVPDKSEADKLVEILSMHFPACRINFDLDDCDKVLRIEGKTVEVSTVTTLVLEKGVFCEALE